MLNVGLKPLTLRSRVACFTDWTRQAPDTAAELWRGGFWKVTGFCLTPSRYSINSGHGDCSRHCTSSTVLCSYMIFITVILTATQYPTE